MTTNPRKDFPDFFSMIDGITKVAQGFDDRSGLFSSTTFDFAPPESADKPKYVRADQLTLGMTVVKPDGSTAVVDNLGRVHDDNNSIEVMLSDAYAYEVWPNTMLEVQ